MVRKKCFLSGQETKHIICPVLSAPKIFYEDTLNEELLLKTGSTLYIEVGVSGIPFPEVAWQHNDKSADESARVTVETQDGYSYLKVKGTSQEDSGIYKVTAENAVGKDEAAFNVCVRGACCHGYCVIHSNLCMVETDVSSLEKFYPIKWDVQFLEIVIETNNHKTCTQKLEMYFVRIIRSRDMVFLSGLL